MREISVLENTSNLFFGRTNMYKFRCEIAKHATRVFGYRYRISLKLSMLTVKYQHTRESVDASIDAGDSLFILWAYASKFPSDEITWKNVACGRGPKKIKTARGETKLSRTRRKFWNYSGSNFSSFSRSRLRNQTEENVSMSRSSFALFNRQSTI